MMAKLTPGQQAYARILADEFDANGDCRKSHYEMAARAGICRTSAKNAQDRLEELGWITVQIRGVEGQRNDTNVITIIDPLWTSWITNTTRRRGGGYKKLYATEHIPNLSIFIEKLERERRTPKPVQQLDDRLAASLQRLGDLVRAKDRPPRTV